MNPVIRTDGLVILTKLPRGPRKGELDFSGDEQARSFNADWLLNYKKAFVLISSERGFTNTKKTTQDPAPSQHQVQRRRAAAVAATGGETSTS